MKEKKLWSYLRSKDFYNQIKLMLAIFFGVIFLSTILLHFYTRHNKYIEVPNFYKLTFRQALELAEDKKLRIEVIDSIFNLDLIPGTIVEQDPKPSTKVKRNRRILLIINALTPQKISFPTIEGVSLRQAVSILEADGLMVNKISYVPDIATHLVLSCKWKGRSIKAGEMITKGSYVDLILGNAGGIKNVNIPDVKGLSIREARKKLTLSYLNTGKIFYAKNVKTAEDSLISVVYKQRPTSDGNSSAPMASTVDLWLTVKSKENE